MKNKIINGFWYILALLIKLALKHMPTEVRRDVLSSKRLKERRHSWARVFFYQLWSHMTSIIKHCPPGRLIFCELVSYPACFDEKSVLEPMSLQLYSKMHDAQDSFFAIESVSNNHIVIGLNTNHWANSSASAKRKAYDAIMEMSKHGILSCNWVMINSKYMIS